MRGGSVPLRLAEVTLPGFFCRYSINSGTFEALMLFE